MLRVKNGVDLSMILPEMWDAAWTAEAVYACHGYDCIITSGREGRHMPGSFHPLGEALDFRRFHVPEHEMAEIFGTIKLVLTRRGFDVVLEAGHLHVERDTKKLGKDT
jgi:hypothetical protein